MNSLDRLIIRKRELTAKNAKIRLNLKVSTRTVRKYLNLLGFKYLVGDKFALDFVNFLV